VTSPFDFVFSVLLLAAFVLIAIHMLRGDFYEYYLSPSGQPFRCRAGKLEAFHQQHGWFASVFPIETLLTDRWTSRVSRVRVALVIWRSTKAFRLRARLWFVIGLPGRMGEV
jgi:hypothetical protein